MKQKNGTSSPKDTFFKKVTAQKIDRCSQKSRPQSKETSTGRNSLEILKRRRDPFKSEGSSGSVKPSESGRFREQPYRESTNQGTTTGRDNVALYSEQFRMKNLPFAYKEFERSYSRLKKYLDRLSVAGDKVPFYRQSFPASTNKEATAKTFSDIYNKERHSLDQPMSSSQQTKNKDSPTSIHALDSQSKLSFQDGSVEEFVREFRLQEEKLIFVLSKLHLPNPEKLAQDPLESIKKAIERFTEIEREEQHTMFVSLSNENHRVNQKASHLEKELEKEGLSHKETLQNFEEKIGQLNEKINDLHHIIIDKEKTIMACNQKLKENNLEQVNSMEEPKSARQHSSTSKSIFEDFDGVIKSLLSDIKAKEDYLDELRENREVSYKEAILSDINQLVYLNTHLKSNTGQGTDDLIDDVHHLQEEMRNLVAKHGKDSLEMQQKFEKELATLKTKHFEEKEILEIKLRAMEQELGPHRPHGSTSPSSVIDELHRKYQNAVTELTQLREYVTRIQKSHSKSAGSHESDLLKALPTSKRSALDGSNAIPSAVLAESKCIFDSLSEESPSVKRAITEALRAREQAIVVKEQEVRSKEDEVNLKLEQTERWAKNAENLINQKIQEINEARDDLDLKTKEVLDREKKLFEREVAQESKPSSVTSTENMSHRAKNLFFKTDDDSILFNGGDTHHHSKEQANLKDQLHQLTIRLSDLESVLHTERVEKERTKADLKSKIEELMKTIEINSILLAKLRQLGFEYDRDNKKFLPFTEPRKPTVTVVEYQATLLAEPARDSNGETYSKFWNSSAVVDQNKSSFVDRSTVNQRYSLPNQATSTYSSQYQAQYFDSSKMNGSSSGKEAAYTQARGETIHLDSGVKNLSNPIPVVIRYSETAGNRDQFVPRNIGSSLFEGGSPQNGQVDSLGHNPLMTNLTNRPENVQSRQIGDSYVLIKPQDISQNSYSLNSSQVNHLFDSIRQSNFQDTSPSNNLTILGQHSFTTEARRISQPYQAGDQKPLLPSRH